MQPIKSLQNIRWFIYAIVAVVVVLGGLAIYIYYSNIKEDNNTMFNIFKKKAEVIETRDFSCPGMEGFTFKYPVFKGLKFMGLQNNKSHPDECFIILDPTSKLLDQKTSDGPIKILKGIMVKIEKISPESISATKERSSVETNPSGISYEILQTMEGGEASGPKTLEFYINDSYVSVQLSGIDENQFFQTVIESFKLTK